MSRLGLALLVLAAAPAYAERPIDGWVPDNGIVVEPPPVTPQGLVPYKKLFLNRCANGCPVGVGTSNSITDKWPISAPGTLKKFPFGDDVWTKVVQCVTDVMAPYNIDVTEVDPGSANHFEIMIGANPADVGFPANVGGVAPPGCGKPYVDNALVFDFAAVWGSGSTCGPRCIEDICATAAQEIGHTWQQMDHVIVKDDPMTYFLSTSRKYFQNVAAQCGSDCVNGVGPGNVTCSGTNNQSHACRCNATTVQTQNSDTVIKGLFGTNPGTPPTVAITNPTADVTLQTGFKVSVTATDDGGIISKVDLKIDGTMIGTVMAPPYDFVAPVTITPGTHHLEAIAYDRLGTPGSGVLDVTVGPPCTSSADCPMPTDACAGGRCVPGPSVTGGLGTACTDATACVDGQCASDGTNMYCVEPCTVGTCPEDFGCLDDGTGKGTGVCWPGYDDGSGGCGCESNRPGGALSFGLLFAVTVFTWRRRRSSLS